MVQMKLAITQAKKRQKSVLNPHGSDETILFPPVILLMRKVLNPHGSDETPPAIFGRAGV